MKYRYPFIMILILFYVQGISAPLADSDSLSQVEMQQIATGILDKLKAAKGILPNEAPTIQVKPFIGSVKIAVMRFEEGIIDLDTRTFKISQTVSGGRDNALSWILGHELGHYVHKHGEINHFEKPSRASVTAFRTNTTTSSRPMHPGFARPSEDDNIIDAFIKTSNEGEADFEGAFLAFLAGYKPMDAGKELIEKIYSDTLGGLNANTPGYPSLDDRKAIIEETTQELAQLTPIYESAKYLSAIGQYADAATLLEDISRKFKSREVYNNIGVLHILHALQSITDQEVKKYKFPLVYDAAFRAPHPQFLNTDASTANSFDIDAVLFRHLPCRMTDTQKFLEKSEEFFQKSIALEPTYPAAYLNLSVAQVIKALLYKGRTCSDEKNTELIKAFSNAYIARDLGYDLLSKSGDIWLEHFDFVPSDATFPISYPEDESIPPEMISEIVVLDTQIVEGSTLINTISHLTVGRPAVWKEKFGQYNLSLDTSLDHRTLHTIWGPVDKVPAAAVLLSKVYVQIDLIQIFMGLLTDDNRLWTSTRNEFDEREVIPFDRALELDRHSSVAKRNQETLLNLPQQQLSNVQKEAHIIPFDGTPISQIEAQTRRWNIAVNKIDTSRLVSFLYSNVSMDESRANKVYYIQANTNLNFSYGENQQYKLYSNNSDNSIDNRNEKSVFLEPVTFDSVVFDEQTIIFPNMHLDSITKKIGRPADNSVPLELGQLASYETSLKQELYQILRNDGSNAPGDTIIQNFRRLVKLDKNAIGLADPETGLSSLTEVDISEHDEYGIIFKIDQENKVTGYVLYYKQIETQGGRLNARRDTQFLILSRD